jgi:hypothetical protein
MITRSRSGHHRVIIRFPSGLHRVLSEWSLRVRNERQETSTGRVLRSVASVTIRRRAPFGPHRFTFRRGGRAGGSRTTVQIGSAEIWEFGSKLLPLATPSLTVSGSREHPLFPTAVIHPCLRPGLGAVVQPWASRPSPRPPDQKQANPAVCQADAQPESGSENHEFRGLHGSHRPGDPCRVRQFCHHSRPGQPEANGG